VLGTITVAVAVAPYRNYHYSKSDILIGNSKVVQDELRVLVFTLYCCRCYCSFCYYEALNN